MQVFLATSDYPDNPMRVRFRDMAVAHWETLQPNEFWIKKGLDLAERERWARERAEGLYCQADDDCLLRPTAFKLRHAATPEPWHAHVQRIMAQFPDLGIVAALTCPPWDSAEVYVEETRQPPGVKVPAEGAPNPAEVWVPPWHRHQTYAPYQDRDGELWTRWPAVGGIKFIRPEALPLAAIPDVQEPRRYDHELAAVVRARGYRTAYLVALPCHHLGHCWSVVGRDSSFNPDGEAC